MFENVRKYLVKIVREEITLQKHIATGKLIGSVHVEAINEGGLVKLVGYLADYGEYVDIGRDAGVTRVLVQALIEWARIKGLGSDNPKSFAFAVREKIFQEGIPTKNSRRLAERRTNFIGQALDSHLDIIRQMVFQVDKETNEIQIHNLVRNTIRKLHG